MSLPSPTTTMSSFPQMDPSELKEMEPPLLALASKSRGDLRRLLYAFFNFLYRRTDFYLVPHPDDATEGRPLKMGFKEGDAEKLLLAAFRQFPLRRMPRQQEAQQRQKKSGSGEGAPPVSNTKTAATTTTAAAPVTAAASSNTDSKKTPPAPPPKNNDKPTEATTTTDAIRFTEEGKQIPIGNGGITSRYRWTQTLHETSVIIAVPEGTRGKDLSVSLRPSSLSIKLKKSTTDDSDGVLPLEGDLTHTIRVDESTWSLEGGALLVTLEKVAPTWWETVIKGDEPSIDTSLVDSTRKIGSYDEATQGAIRKVLFDQRQQRLGLPTSDEILGATPAIPPMPKGVEYIDQAKLDSLNLNSGPSDAGS